MCGLWQYHQRRGVALARASSQRVFHTAAASPPKRWGNRKAGNPDAAGTRRTRPPLGALQGAIGQPGRQERRYLRGVVGGRARPNGMFQGSGRACGVDWVRGRPSVAPAPRAAPRARPAARPRSLDLGGSTSSLLACVLLVWRLLLLLLPRWWRTPARSWGRSRSAPSSAPRSRPRPSRGGASSSRRTALRGVSGLTKEPKGRTRQFFRRQDPVLGTKGSP